MGLAGPHQVLQSLERGIGHLRHLGAIVAATGSRQFSRRWSGPQNPKGQPGQKPVAKAPAVEIVPPTDGKIGALADARLADLAEIAERIRASSGQPPMSSPLAKTYCSHSRGSEPAICSVGS